MKETYPIIIKQAESGYCVRIPDFSITTQADTVDEAISMAWDAIGIVEIDMLDDGKELPRPNSAEEKPEAGDIVEQVTVDFTEYRRKLGNGK